MGTSTKNRFRRSGAHARLAGVLASLLSSPLQEAAAGGSDATWAYLQLGSSGHTHQLALGVLSPWTRSWALGQGELTGYWDFSLSRWEYRSATEHGQELLSQLGIKPTFRWWRGGSSGSMFLEGGVGATLTSSLYRTDGKRFSTRFNFGDHIAIGWALDAQRTQEVTLRIEHFSNAGIKHPNPGAEFFQIRYASRF